MPNSFLYPRIGGVGQPLLPPGGGQQGNLDLLRSILGLAQSPLGQGLGLNTNQNILGGTQGLQQDRGLRLQDRDDDRETFGQSNVGPSTFSGIGSQAGPSSFGGQATGTPGFGGVPSGSTSTVSTPGMSPGLSNAIAGGLTGLASFGIGAVGGPIAGLVASAIGRAYISPMISNALQASNTMSFDDFLGAIDSGLAEHGIEAGPVDSPFDSIEGLSDAWDDMVDEALGFGAEDPDETSSDISDEAAAGMDAEAEAEDAAEAGGSQDEDDTEAEDDSGEEGDEEGDEGGEEGDDSGDSDDGGDDDDDGGGDDGDDDDGDDH